MIIPKPRNPKRLLTSPFSTPWGLRAYDFGSRVEALGFGVGV